MTNNKVNKVLKGIAIICAIVLVIELIYIIFFIERKSVYFDGVNSISLDNKNIITVGSNNNNDKYFERAKLTKYNSKKEKKFENLYNKGYNGSFLDVIVDKDENVIAVGSYEATEDEHKKGIRTALIVKYDKDGNLLYEADFQLLGDSKYTQLVEVDDGYIVVGQSIYEKMIVGTSKEGGAYIVKYDKDLDVEWMENYGNPKTAIYNDVIVVHDKIYAVGKGDSKVGVIVRYDLDGTFEEQVKYKDMDDLGFTSIVYSHGKLFTCGGKPNRDKHNYADAFIAQYDLELNFEKEITYDDKKNERYNKLIVDEEDNIVAIGLQNVISKKNIPGAHDGIIAKYDENLEKIKVEIYGDNRDDYFTDIVIYDNNYLVTGYSSYEDGSYLNKFINYSYALKVLEVE